MRRLFWLICFLFVATGYGSAQKLKSQKGNLVYVDAQGVLRYTKDKTEAQFFGVNYTVPFAYGYRSHKALGIDIEKAIDADVYHFARLGFDGFRVHVWDTEITDSLGNLKNNEHLRLFDYLVFKLKERNIKIFLTPLAFWGNGYPEKDNNTGSFSSKWNKQKVLTTEEAIKAQENYLAQLLKHVNPYTKLKYEDDIDIIALEINNEPHHSGTKTGVADYINRMVKAVKGAGWSKPVFYNISESPAYADVVANAAIDGVSFQWYPTGLVANRSLKGNYLPNVDLYKIPFGDTIPAYRNKARMVYEFDAGDVFESYMYPAMARSFRTAGFQWATQFAYDPMATAYANTEYQTHYLNLAYTPSKAISLLIAGKVFQKVPRSKNYGSYPADTLFEPFRVSYKQQLSEMNSEEEFYYSNSTSTYPKNVSKLKRLAGVGSSPVVTYEGTGAYFLDKIEDGVWRLEVMPDAIHIRDPFEKASPKKEVTRIQWQANKMQLNLPVLKGNLIINGINKGNDYKTIATTGEDFFISPGVYNISISNLAGAAKDRLVPLPEFYAPPTSAADPFVVHQSLQEVTSGKPFYISAKIVGIDTTDKITIEVRNSLNKWKTLTMQKIAAYDYTTEVPAEMVTPGVINYRIMVRNAKDETYTFPGAFKGDPYAWDEYRNESWQTFVAAPGSGLEIFNAVNDRNEVLIFNPDWRSNTTEYVATGKSKNLALKTTMTKPASGQVIGWQYYFGDKISGRELELASFSKIVIRARSEGETKLKLSLITSDADAYAIAVSVTKDWKEIEIPFSSLQKDAFLLLPRPYPGFLPLKFGSAGTRAFDIKDAEKLEISFAAETGSTPVSIEMETVYFKK